MHHTTTRLIARVCTALVAVLLLVAPATAKPKADNPGKAKKAGVTKQVHGKAVRIAAKCPIEGKAKGQLVKSIARNKSATPEDATAACEAALALEEGEDAPDEELPDDEVPEDEVPVDEVPEELPPA